MKTISKKLALAFCGLSILCISLCQAQDEFKTGKELAVNKQGTLSIGVMCGLSAPYGKFATSNYSDPASGFTSTGYNFNVSGTYFLAPSFAIKALIGYQHFSSKGLLNLALGFKDAYAIDSCTTYSAGSNYSINILAGPSYTIALTNKFSLEGHLLVGITNSHIAGVQVFLEDNENATFEQKAASKTTWAVQPGISFNYLLTNKLTLSVNTDLFYSKPKFSVSNDNRKNIVGRYITQYDQPITSNNSNIGVSYRLFN